MKRLIFFIFLFNALTVFSQDNTVTLQDLKTPNSPGFQILDISPSSIERPTNPKEFALSVLNLSNNATVIPKNFAFEITPYWYFKPSDANVYKYLNIRQVETKTDAAGTHSITQNNTTTGILNKLSISLASSFSDSTSGSLLQNTNYVSFGARTNLLTLRSAAQNNAFAELVINMSTRMRELRQTLIIKKTTWKNSQNLLNNKADSLTKANADTSEINKQITVLTDSLKAFDKAFPQTLEEALENDQEYLGYKGLIEKFTGDELPLFQLDAAFAYSEAFVNNEYNNRRFNRSGFWLSAALSAGHLLKSKKDEFSIIVLGKAIWDDPLTDTVKNIFERKNAYDIGGKLDWTIGSFSLSFEHLNRFYSQAKNLNSKRTVGIAQYKINDKLYITATYGDNFGNENNLITLLGINWNFGNSPLSIPNP